jgi:hypothetical protein
MKKLNMLCWRGVPLYSILPPRKHDTASPVVQVTNNCTVGFDRLMYINQFTILYFTELADFSHLCRIMFEEVIDNDSLIFL